MRAVQVVRWALASLLALGMWIPAGASPAAEPVQRMEIILDASGSMWGQVGGQAKISVAQRVLLDLVKALEGREGLELAVRVYGHQSHRDLKDCTDSRLELPFAPPDLAAAQALMGRIKAQGYTPIAYSLLQAKDDFDPQRPGKKSIVLITDGLESCDGDPCAAARELAGAGLEVVLHVVGFDLGQAEMAKLRCLTEPSGGLLLAARDAGELARALDQVVQDALAENLVIRGVTSGGQPLFTYVTVYQAGSKVKVARRSGTRAAFKLPAGAYDVVVTAGVGQDQRLAGIALNSDQLTEKEVVFAQGRLGAILKDAQGRPVRGHLRILAQDPSGRTTAVARGQVFSEPLVFDLAPGTYTLEVTRLDTREIKRLEGITLADGQEIVKEVVFTKARLGAKASDPQGRPVEVFVLARRQQADGTWRTEGRGNAFQEAAVFDVEPGLYNLEVTRKDTRQKRLLDSIEVADGQEVVKEVVFARARLGARARDAQGQPVRVHVVARRQQADGTWKGAGRGNGFEEAAVFDVEPGLYNLEVTNRDTGEKRLIEGIELADGQEVVKEIAFAQARLGAIAKDDRGGQVRAHLRAVRRLKDGSAKVEGRGNTKEGPLVFDLPPGTYDLEVRNQATKEKRTFAGIELADGQEVIKEAVFQSARLGGILLSSAGQPVRGYLRAVLVQEGGGDQAVARGRVFREPLVFDLPPGKYQLEMEVKATHERKTFTVELQAGQEVIKKFIVD